MAEENLIDRLVNGDKIKCKECNKGYYIPFNTTADKAHAFNCSNPNCSSSIHIDPVIDIE